MILKSSTFLVYAMEMLTLYREDHALTADTATVLSKRQRALQPQIWKWQTLSYVVYSKAQAKLRMGIACHPHEYIQNLYLKVKRFKTEVPVFNSFLKHPRSRNLTLKFANKLGKLWLHFRNSVGVIGKL